MVEQKMTLQTRTVGAVPLINHFIERLGLSQLLEDFLCRPGRQPLVSHPSALLILLRNLLVGREPLYGMGDWVESMEPSLLDGHGRWPRRFHDDRVGKALDRLFAAKLSALTLALVRRAVDEFELDLSQLHNDTTTVTLSGEYAGANGHAKEGKPTLAITWGHNKDHRPDLKQLLVELTVTADGAVPVFFDAHHGNTTDDQLHRHTWDVLVQILGRTDFLYVADCKLCVRETMEYIAGHGGRFLTVLPRSRAEDQKFKDFLQTHQVEWQKVWSRPNRRGEARPADIYRAYTPKPGTAEGYQLVWYHSSDKERQDRRRRQDQIHQAHLDLDGLNERLRSKRSRLRTEEAVRNEVRKILSARNAERWIQVDIQPETHEHFKQETPGRPGPNTRYVRTESTRYTLSWRENTDQLQYDHNTDGIFPLVSNDHRLSPKQMLLAYKQQPRLEKRFEQLKTVYAVMPVFLKSVSRIEAFLHVYFWALLIETLIERELRQAMKRQGMASLPLYPEERLCHAPTADRVFTIFDRLQVSRLSDNRQQIQIFQPKLSDLQKQLLRLLHVPRRAYQFT